MCQIHPIRFNVDNVYTFVSESNYRRCPRMGSRKIKILITSLSVNLVFTLYYVGCHTIYTLILCVLMCLCVYASH